MFLEDPAVGAFFCGVESGAMAVFERGEGVGVRFATSADDPRGGILAALSSCEGMDAADEVDLAWFELVEIIELRLL